MAASARAAAASVALKPGGVANPGASPVTLHVQGPVSTLPRVEYVLTPEGGDDTAHAPVLNHGAVALRLGPQDGSLPDMPGRFCGKSDDCATALALPALSQSFLVLLDAHAQACMT